MNERIRKQVIHICMCKCKCICKVDIIYYNRVLFSHIKKEILSFLTTRTKLEESLRWLYFILNSFKYELDRRDVLPFCLGLMWKSKYSTSAGWILAGFAEKGSKWVDLRSGAASESTGTMVLRDPAPGLWNQNIHGKRLVTCGSHMLPWWCFHFLHIPGHKWGVQGHHRYSSGILRL